MVDVSQRQEKERLLQVHRALRAAILRHIAELVPIDEAQAQPHQRDCLGKGVAVRRDQAVGDGLVALPQIDALLDNQLVHGVLKVARLIQSIGVCCKGIPITRHWRTSFSP